MYDILRGSIIIVATIVLSRWGNISRVYHYIRGEAFIKLYVIFNILEVRLSVVQLVEGEGVHHTD